ncbi:MAG: 50S ribosomal protein L25 [Deltaproteobacteria bacterium]|nr:50S ribosomal protein L25 [Deltaproteobacteria bacterium]MBI3293232.1 50S ribosomal protein L25 [Deltaproteobacteria bacterium]
MEVQTLEVSIREQLGKGAARRTRMAGNIPGVLYGTGKATSVTVSPRSVTSLLLQEGGQNRVLTLKGTGVEGRAAMIKDYQVDPLSRKLLHIDLLEIDLAKKIQVTVKLNFVGRPIGVADGGVMNIIERAIAVRCLPNQIPAHIDVDVAALKIADSIHLADITLPTGVERMPNVNPTLVTVVPPAKDEELAPSLAPSAEPEVITEKKAAEGEEGAAPAAGGKDEKAAAPAAKKEEKKK